LKKVKTLGFGGPGLKIRVLTEHSFPARRVRVRVRTLGEGRIYNIL
jgi:hypothetical protein